MIASDNLNLVQEFMNFCGAKKCLKLLNMLSYVRPSAFVLLFNIVFR